MQKFINYMQDIKNQEIMNAHMPVIQFKIKNISIIFEGP